MHIEELRRLRSFFLQAANQGYASGQPATILEELLGAKIVEVTSEGLHYIDAWHSNGEFSFGTTFLAKEGVGPVWHMQYRGWCKEEDATVIAFLKRALTECYANGEWLGGRGPSCFMHQDYPNLVYRNRVSDDHNDFSNFHGREAIVRTGEEEVEVFFHTYAGMIMSGDMKEIQALSGSPCKREVCR